MRNLKKAFALVVVLAMVLTLFVGIGSASAAADYSSSVVKMQKFGVLVGDASGNLMADKPVTRAQCAVMVVKALGLADAAAAAGAPVKFKDVDATRPEAGFIAVAEQLGIVAGISADKFDPDSKVTLAQALAFVERAMGYEKYAQKLGGFPTGNIALASIKVKTVQPGPATKLDLLNSIKTEPTGLAAARGLVCKLLDNALALPFFAIGDFNGTDFVYSADKDVTFLAKMEFSKVEDATIVKTPGMGGEAGKVSYITGAGSKAGAATDIDYAAVEAADSFFGVNATLWTKDSKVQYVEKNTAAADVVKISTLEAGADATKVKINGTEYGISGNVGAYLNWTAANLAAPNFAAVQTALTGALGYSDKKVDATVVLKGGNADYIYGTVYSGKYAVDSTLSNTVSKIKKIVAGAKTIYLENTDKAAYTLTKDGKDIAFADIAAGDLVYYAAKADAATVAAKDNTIKVLILNKEVKGSITAATPNYAAATKLTIGTTQYDLIAGTSLAGIAFGDAVIAKLDIDGKIYSVAADTAVVTADKYAIVKNAGTSLPDAYGNTTEYVKLLLADGTSKEYVSTIAKATTLVNKGKLVKFGLDSDGKVSTITAAGTASGALKIDKTNNKLGTMPVKSDVLVFNVKSIPSGDVDAEVVKWADVKANDAQPLYAYVTDGDFSYVTVIVANNLAGASTSDFNYAIVKTDSYQSGTDANTFTAVESGKDVTLTTAGITYTAVANKVIKYKIDVNGKATQVSVLAAVYDNANFTPIAAIDNTLKSVKIGSDSTVYAYADGIAVYDLTSDSIVVTNISALAKDVKVKLYLNADGNVAIVVINNK